MEMIDRYIYAVTKKLPQNQRQDIADEIRGLIEDMLDERIGNGKTQEKNLEDILLEIGSPRELADKYRDKKKYLIGPELYDSYMIVLKIVLITLGASIGIKFIVETVLDPLSILDYFIDMIISLVTGFPMALGWTTFGFALGEMFGDIREQDILKQTWHPSDLPELPNKKSQIKRCEPIGGIIFYAIALVFFAFSSDFFGVWVFQDGFTGVVPFLNEQTYDMYRLVIILLLGISILKECIKLVIGKWTVKLAVISTILNAISLTIILFLINQADFWNPTFMQDLVASDIVSFGSDAYDVVSKVWDQVTLWLVIILVIGLIWETIDAFLKTRKN